MTQLEDNFVKDIQDIRQIPIVANILDVICQTTGMGFSAIARVTEDRWITCSARDDIGFGLKPGDELEVKTTICDEIRQSHTPVIIDNVKEDPIFCTHHTPAMYGLQSYISIPIIKKDGSFFGTLCAIDPHPHIVSSPKIINMFYLFADLISFHLAAIESVRETEQQLVKEKAFNEVLEKKVNERTQELAENNTALEKANKELQSFTYISSHDLQEPLRKIQTIASLIADKENINLTDKGKDYFKRMQNAAHRMQLLINDLLAYSRTGADDNSKFEMSDLYAVLEDVKNDLQEELQGKDIIISTGIIANAPIIPFQLRQLLYNLFSNSVKYASPNRPLVINISSEIAPAKDFNVNGLSPDINYCRIRVADNGIGFDQKYSEKIFELFKRLHDKSYPGTGIGLAIVKKIAENHHGLVTATGTPGEGAIFDVYIPANGLA